MLFLILISFVYYSPCHGILNGTYCTCSINWNDSSTNCSHFDNGACIKDCFYGLINLSPCGCSCDSINFNGDNCSLNNTCSDQCINGVCERDNPPNNEIPTCNCTAEYEGTWCNIKIENLQSKSLNKNNDDEIITNIAAKIP